MHDEPIFASLPESPSVASLEGTALPSPNSVELSRTASADYRHRFDGRDPHVAELFQENTKLSPRTTGHHPADAGALERAREWYLSTAYRVKDDTLVARKADAVRLPLDALPRRLAELLEPFTGTGRPSSLLYALDLFVLHEKALLRVVPRTGFLWRDRRTAERDDSRIRESIVSTERLPTAGALLFLVAAPWRYMMFLGPRGVPPHAARRGRAPGAPSGPRGEGWRGGRCVSGLLRPPRGRRPAARRRRAHGRRHRGARGRGVVKATANAGGAVRRELLAELEKLTPAEQGALAELARRYRAAPPRAGEPSGLAFVQSFLKADPRLGTFQTPVRVPAEPPGMVKQFPGRRRIRLPDSVPDAAAGLRDALERRRSSHDFGSAAMPLSALAGLLHASYGVRNFGRAYDVRDFPFRYAPSAGGLQPIDLYLVANDVDGLARGLYCYDPVAAALTLLDEGNLRRRMSGCALGQSWLAYAHAVLVLVCNLPRVFWKYGDRGYRFAHADAGVLAQNLYLVGTALGLTTCAVAGFYDDAVHDLLDLDGRDECAVLLFAVGARPEA